MYFLDVDDGSDDNEGVNENDGENGDVASEKRVVSVKVVANVSLLPHGGVKVYDQISSVLQEVKVMGSQNLPCLKEPWGMLINLLASELLW
ncbi:hypothetical protein TSUD_301850 [Trifolium subterraneum]|uniref:Uncharacterized protein n=1 Tax=Trifolium subterraneum TaxID=3900 RepID=A0A2Z6P421_TRISU|nr:hypothetical protein TSUD_301850 [Trifolium subterraneum]